MEAKTALHLIRQTFRDAKLEDAQAFLDICEMRGLTPFQEAHFMLVKGKVAVKEHYTVQSRWAHKAGGYATIKHKTWMDGGDYMASIIIASNQSYAGVGKLAAACGWSRAEFKEELMMQAVTGIGRVTAREIAKKKYPPAGKDWFWLARKRAREEAERKVFGKEPSQSRQIYAAIAADNARRQAELEDAGHLLYPSTALPAPKDDGNGVIEGELVEPMTIEKARQFAAPSSDIEQVQKSLYDEATKHPQQETNNKRRALYASMLDRCFDGDSDKRRLVTWWIFDTPEGSAKNITEGATRAWLNRYVDRDGGGYALTENAHAEMGAAYTAALKATGQQSLFDSDAQAPKEAR